jgi:hypothetical protein
MFCQKFKFNATYDVTQIFYPLSDWRRTQFERTNRKLAVHADSAQRHTAKMILRFTKPDAMKRDPHPPYSPYLTSFGFYLFGRINLWTDNPQSDCCCVFEQSLKRVITIMNTFRPVMKTFGMIVE